MITYLKNVIEQFPEEISGRALSLVAEHLFAMRDESKAARCHILELTLEVILKLTLEVILEHVLGIPTCFYVEIPW